MIPIIALLVAAEPVAPPPIRVVMPMQQPAPTAEIVGGIDACRLALGDTGKFDESVFENLHWRRGATYRDAASDVRTEYYHLNVLNDVVRLDRIDGCATKAKISDLRQLEAVRQAATIKFGLKSPEEMSVFSGLVQQMVDRFGESARQKLLVGDKFVLVLEPTTRQESHYIAVTFVPVTK